MVWLAPICHGPGLRAAQVMPNADVERWASAKYFEIESIPPGWPALRRAMTFGVGFPSNLNDSRIQSMSVEEIQKAIAELPPDELDKFRAWFEEFAADEWDRQIEQDAQNGKLDKLFVVAMDDLKAGRVKKL